MTHDDAVQGMLDALRHAWNQGYGHEHRKAHGLLADPEHFLAALVECADLSGDQVMELLDELGRVPKKRRWSRRFPAADVDPPSQSFFVSPVPAGGEVPPGTPLAEVIPIAHRGAISEEVIQWHVRTILASELQRLRDSIARDLRRGRAIP